jgi:glycolate oxidase
MLAVTTEVTVKLVPKPQLARCIMASFDDIRKAGDAVAAIIAAGIIPAGLEMMDKPMTAAVEDFVHAGYDLTPRPSCCAKATARPRRWPRRSAACSTCCRRRRHAHGGQQGRGAAPEVLERAQERLPGQRAASAPTTCAWTRPSRASAGRHPAGHPEMEKKYGLKCCNVFHAGDGNLHPLILFDANDPDQLHRCELFGADILETSVRLGGTVTGEHGVGVEKLNSMCVQFSPAEREQMLALKRAFDPRALLNPGKVIPTLQRCAEYGKMHVKQGAAALPRAGALLMAGRDGPGND